MVRNSPFLGPEKVDIGNFRALFFFFSSARSCFFFWSSSYRFQYGIPESFHRYFYQCCIPNTNFTQGKKNCAREKSPQAWSVVDLVQYNTSSCSKKRLCHDARSWTSALRKTMFQWLFFSFASPELAMTPSTITVLFCRSVPSKSTVKSTSTLSPSPIQSIDWSIIQFRIHFLTLVFLDMLSSALCNHVGIESSLSAGE